MKNSKGFDKSEGTKKKKEDFHQKFLDKMNSQHKKVYKQSFNAGKDKFKTRNSLSHKRSFMNEQEYLFKQKGRKKSQ